jgi:tRNA U34 5-methylaminomethyl-2-thiouridine-forming methyltransferase MnmC
MTAPVATEDLSYTLYSEQFGEHYHSVFGARSEAMHVFIEAALRCALANRMPANISAQANAPTAAPGGLSVLEVGFGTGLNAWLTALEAERSGCLIAYETLELFPLEPSQVEQLYQVPLFLSIHKAPWEHPARITPHFELTKRQVDFLSCPLGGPYDVVYFDAFSPNVQPQMWSGELFGKLYRAMVPGGVLTTYCVKGDVRRAMQQAGFITEKIPGPKGKREILRAHKPL